MTDEWSQIVLALMNKNAELERKLAIAEKKAIAPKVTPSRWCYHCKVYRAAIICPSCGEDSRPRKERQGYEGYVR